MPQDAGGDKETAGVRPGDDLVLAPPPRDHNAAHHSYRKELSLPQVGQTSHRIQARK